MSMSTTAETIYIGTVRAGTTIAQMPDGRLVAIHPEERPLLITIDGLKHFDVVDLVADDCDATLAIGTLGQFPV